MILVNKERKKTRQK